MVCSMRCIRMAIKKDAITIASIDRGTGIPNSNRAPVGALQFTNWFNEKCQFSSYGRNCLWEMKIAGEVPAFAHFFHLQFIIPFSGKNIHYCLMSIIMMANKLWRYYFAVISCCFQQGFGFYAINPCC